MHADTTFQLQLQFFARPPGHVLSGSRCKNQSIITVKILVPVHAWPVNVLTDYLWYVSVVEGP